MATVIESLLVKLGFKTDTRGADDFSRRMERIEEQAEVFAMFLGAAFATFSLAKAADEVTLMNDRLTDLTGSAEAAAEMQDKLYESSQRLGVDQVDMSKAAARALPSLQEMGKGVDEAIKLSEILAVTARLSGASTDEAAASAQQFSQALGSGTLAGDELKSILENNQALARTLAKEIGVPLGHLKKLGEDGKITSKLMADSLLGAYDKVMERSKGLSDTFGMMMLRFKNWFFSATRQLQDAGVFQVFIDGLKGIWQWLEELNSSGAVKNFAIKLTENLKYLSERFGAIRKVMGQWLDDMGLSEYKTEALSAIVFLLTANMVGLAAAAVRVGIALLTTPIAWLGAALIGLFLIIDDLMGYQEGRPSFIGKLMEDYPWIKTLKDVFVDALTAIKDNLGLVSLAILYLSRNMIRARLFMLRWYLSWQAIMWSMRIQAFITFSAMYVAGVASFILMIPAMLKARAAALVTFVTMRAAALASYAMIAAAAISSALATAATWLIALAPFILLIALIAAAVAAFWWLYENWDQVWQVISGIAGSTIETILEYWNGMIDSMVGAWRGAVQWITELFAPVLGLVDSAVQKWQGFKSFIGFGGDAAVGLPAGALAGGGTGGNTTINTTVTVPTAAGAAQVAREANSGAAQRTRSAGSGVAQ